MNGLTREEWLKLKEFEEPEDPSERYCADCGADIPRWRPAHPVEGWQGVLCTKCWVKGLTSSGPGGIEAAINSSTGSVR
jgi:hypothetical protein